MRTTLMATISALALLATPVLAGGGSHSGMDSGTAAGATDRTGSGQAQGGTEQPASIDKEQLRAALEANGFTDVGDPVRVGDLYQVEATKDGQKLTLLIDPVTGQVGLAE